MDQVLDQKLTLCLSKNGLNKVLKIALKSDLK